MSMAAQSNEMVLTVDGVVTADQVADVLRAGGVPALSVEFVGSDWPHMATLVARTADGDRRGVVTFECVVTASATKLIAKVSLIEDDEEDEANDGMPPADE
jgi:hypothetical protein